jgi:hypothetical protein
MDPEEQAASFSEFLALARDEGLVSLGVSVVQAADPASGRGAVVTATARSSQHSFSAVGEASTASAPPEWHPYLTTLAELRAKARALRELTGLDHGVVEELSVPYQSVESQSHQAEERPVRSAWASSAAAPARREQVPVGGPRPISGPTGARIAERPPAPEQQTDDMPEDDEDAEDEPRTVPMRPAQTYRPGPDVQDVQSEERDDEPEEPVPGGIEPAMEAKLLRLAMTIAEREGESLSEAEARTKLDDFFIRAFKHPLSRATQQEGQRVVHRLASDLARIRPRSTED